MNEYETPDFCTEVSAQGSVLVPASYLSSVGFSAGAKVSIRVSELAVSEDLRERGITNEEVDRIGHTQLEARENVLEFLSSEGSLASNTRSVSRLRTWLRSGE